MSLKKVCKNRVINHILNCTSKENRKILICDEYGLMVISSMFKMKEMVEKGVTSIEPLMKNRQPLKMEAIYFVSATEVNIKRIIQDFSNSPLYLRAHIFTTGHISLNLIDEIKNSNLIKRLKTLSESYLNFFVKEKNVFTLDTQNFDAFPILYGNSSENTNEYFF